MVTNPEWVQYKRYIDKTEARPFDWNVRQFFQPPKYIGSKELERQWASKRK